MKAERESERQRLLSSKWLRLTHTHRKWSLAEPALGGRLPEQQRDPCSWTSFNFLPKMVVIRTQTYPGSAPSSCQRVRSKPGSSWSDGVAARWAETDGPEGGCMVRCIMGDSWWLYGLVHKHVARFFGNIQIPVAAKNNEKNKHFLVDKNTNTIRKWD